MSKKPRKRLPTPPRKPIDFTRLIKRVSDLYGNQAATAWTKTVLGYQSSISDDALRSAIASKRISNIEAVIRPTALQQQLAKAMEPPLLSAMQVIGAESAQVLTSRGLSATFNAFHPNVVLFARTRAAEMVVGIPQETKQIIAEVIARGAERGLTVVQQARAIKEVIGLPPNWASAADNFSVELQSGNISAATNRKLSGRLKQQIRSRAAAGTLDDAFIQQAASEYTQTLVSLRARTIARTETMRASNQGLLESWGQARSAGALPPNTRVFWIVTPDDRLCPICSRIPGMNKKGRALGESFMTPEGLVDAPPAPHPNCRCALGLGFPS